MATLRSGSVWPTASATRTQRVAFGLSFRAYAIGRWPRYANANKRQ
ncbi:MAG: hypothetical protein F6K55_06480 [Moorea sp. SIO4A3]|nr:hypothetical protein [Moorena sp. SIO4A3]